MAPEAPAPPDTPADALEDEHAGPATEVWLHEGPELVGLVGDAAYYWDSEMGDAGGIASISVKDGRPLAKRAIKGLNINGKPSLWLAGMDGDIVASWGESAMLLAATGDDQAGSSSELEVRWRAPQGRWGEAIIVDDKLVMWDFAPRQAIVAFSARTGAELWQAPLEREANGVSLDFDGESIVVIWQQYSATAPTPTVTIPQRVRTLDPATGRARWTRDFKDPTGGLSVAGETLIVAEDSDLRFLQGSTGALLRKVETGHSPTIYPRFEVDGNTAYVALRGAVTAYDARTGAVAWTHPIELDGPAMTLSGEHLLVSGAHVLVALDRATGRRAWEVSLGFSPYRLEANDRGVVAIGGGSAGFSLPARFEPERATLRGEVELRCVQADAVQLRVGPIITKLDSQGRYTASIETAGIVRISASAETELDLERQAHFPAVERVALDGAGTYDVPTMLLDHCDR